MTRDHRKFRVFQRADALIVPIYAVTAKLPPEERFGLQAQLRRAAISAATNIVEGSARPTTSDYLKFLDISRGSARECEYLLGLIVRLGFVTATDVAALADGYAAVAAG